MKKCNFCQKFYKEIPTNALLVKGPDSLPGYYYNCECKSTLYWPENKFGFGDDSAFLEASRVFLVVLAALSLILFFTGCGGSGGGSASSKAPTDPVLVDNSVELVDYECRYVAKWSFGIVYAGEVYLYETLTECNTYGFDVATNPTASAGGLVQINGTTAQTHNYQDGALYWTIYFDTTIAATEASGIWLTVDYN